MASGADILAMIERLLGDTRGELDNVDTRLARATAELDRLKQAELGVLAVLAKIRLREIESGEVVEALDDTGKRVQELLGRRAQAQARAEVELLAAQDALAQRERKRETQRAAVAAAEQAVAAAEAAAQEHLKADAAYCAQLDKAHASDGVADLAEAKAQAAHTDRTEKGRPYESDPLFAYLWARGYGTSAYRAGSFARLFDGWVARVDHYEPLRQNYWMLTELPARFDEHAQRMRALANEDFAAVQALEKQALESAGVPERKRTLAAAADTLAKLDQDIAAQETAVRTLVDKRAAFASGDDDLSRECTKILGDAFRREQMRTLRERANRTATPEDDAAVDQLTEIRANLPRVEQDAARYREQHDTHSDRGAKLEELRRRFKEERFDGVSSEFVNGALIATLLGQLVSGALGVPDVWDSLRKQQRYRDLGVDPRFGSGRFPRFPGGGPWGGGWGGGRGGGFGGGGFGSGGGFGGGGFRTGGGF